MPLLLLLDLLTLRLPQVRLPLVFRFGRLHANVIPGDSTASQSGSGAGAASTGAADKASARLAGAGLAGLLAIFAL
jgi:hypothetical protein